MNTKNTLIKDGRKPISAKAKPPEMLADDLFGNTLALHPDDQKELESKGLVGRWVDATRMAQMQGYHSKGWRTYRRTTSASDTINPLEFKYGSDPTGVIRRGSLILAVKTKDEAERHRAYLNQRAERQASANKEEAEKLRSFAKSAGLKAQIFEGYEENEAPGI